ncbi:MAG: hypothetical protein V7641_285 [Blastocatellia bacterium]
MNNSQTYGVLVGIDQYKQLSPLVCSTNDAVDMAAVLGAGTDPSHLKLLTNAAATKKAILEKLAWLSRKARSGDTALVYFSGHGGRNSSAANEQAFFCPVEAAPKDFKRTCISSTELTVALRAIKAERLVVLLDTCYAGGLGEPRNRGARLSIELNRRDVDNLIEGRGRVILAASRPDESAWEMREKRNGVFSTYVLRALHGEAARPDGTIWVTDLFSYVSRCVLQHKQQPQHPYQKTIGEDFVVWVRGDALPRKTYEQGLVPPEVDQRLLRPAIRSAYDRGDFEILCRNLGLSIDDLSDHRPLEVQIMELIDHCRRHNRHHQLLNQVRADRPHLAIGE